MVNRIVWSALPFAALLVAGCAGSKTEPATGTLTGKAIYANESDSSGISVALDGPVHQSALTAADGTYTFQSLPAGSYALLFTPTAAQERPQIRTASVSATPGSTVANVVFTAIGALSGTATFGSTTGNSGILVVSPGSAAVAVTDDAGNFTLRGLPTGTVDVIASAPGFASASDHAVAVVHNTTQPAPALTLQAGSAGIGAITGQVILAGMSAQAGIPVTLQGINSSAAVLTDATGAITFTGLPDGQYALTAIVHDALRVSETLAVQVLGGQQLSSPQFHFTPTGLVSGIATLQGATAGNAGITTTALGAPSVTVTNDSGAYLLLAVPVGSFNIVASYPDRQSAVTSAPVQVAWGQTTTAPALTLGPPLDAIGQVQGTVTLTGLSDAHGIIVTLSGATPGVYITGNSGGFTFKNLVAGNYTLTASALSTAESTATIGFTISAAAPFVAGANFTFTPVGSAQGKVANQQGASVAGALVVAQGTSRSTLSDTSGNFLLSGIPAGPAAVLSASVVGSESAPVSVAITYAPQAPSIADAGTLTLSNVVQANVAIAGQFSLYGGPFGTTPDPSKLTVNWTGAAAGSTKVDSSGAWNAVTPVGFYSLSVGEDDALRSATIPNALAMSGGEGFVVADQLYPLASPLELEYGTQVVSGQKVSPILTDPRYLGNAIFTVSYGTVAVNQPRQAEGTLALFHNHHVTLVPGAVPDIGNSAATGKEMQVAAAGTLPEMQIGPQGSAVYLENGMANLALADGSIHPLGIQVTDPNSGAPPGRLSPFQLNGNVASGGNVIAIIGMNQGAGACASDRFNGNSLYPVYAVNVTTPSSVKLVGCATNANDGTRSLFVSPDGLGVWIEWTGNGNGLVDTVVQSNCDLNDQNSDCPANNIGGDYNNSTGLNLYFSSDGSAVVMSSQSGVLLASSDGTSLTELTNNVGTQPANDSFTVYPAQFAGTAVDVLEVDVSGALQNYGCCYTTSMYLMPFQAAAGLPGEPTAQTSEYPGISSANWPFQNFNQNNQRSGGVVIAPQAPWYAPSHLAYTVGGYPASDGTVVAVSFSDVVTGSTTGKTLSTTANVNLGQAQMLTVNGNDYVLFLDQQSDGGSSTTVLEEYSFTAGGAATPIASDVTQMMTQQSQWFYGNVAAPNWIGWATSGGEASVYPLCFATRIDVPSSPIVSLGPCQPGYSMTFSDDGKVVLFTQPAALTGANNDVPALADLSTTSPVPVPIVVDGLDYISTDTQAFLSDDRIALSGWNQNETLGESLVVGLDANAPGGFSLLTLANHNYGADVANNWGDMPAQKLGGLVRWSMNQVPSRQTAWGLFDVEILAAGSTHPIDLGTLSMNLNARESKFPFKLALLADGSNLMLMRAGVEGVTDPDTGVGSLVAASTSGWAVHMLSHASDSYAIVPGTMEILGTQQRTQAPWGMQDGVYVLASPPAPAVRSAQARR